MNRFLFVLSLTQFGKAGALCQGMMSTFTHTIETPERAAAAQCTLEQAAQLLESLRAAYQSLSSAERSLAKSILSRRARVQYAQELQEEMECFEFLF